MSGGVTASPEAASQTRAVLSIETVSSRRLSGLKRACQMYEAWRNGGVTARPVAASQTTAVVSSLPVTMNRPSGL